VRPKKRAQSTDHPIGVQAVFAARDFPGTDVLEMIGDDSWTVGVRGQSLVRSDSRRSLRQRK